MAEKTKLLATSIRTGILHDAIYQVTASDTVLGTINNTRSTCDINGKTFKLTHTGIISPVVEMKDGDSLLVTAKRKPFRFTYNVSTSSAEMTFKATNLSSSKFGLFQNEVQCGSISPGKIIEAHLPASLSLQIQMFLLALYIRIINDSGS